MTLKFAGRKMKEGEEKEEERGTRSHWHHSQCSANLSVWCHKPGYRMIVKVLLSPAELELQSRHCPGLSQMRESSLQGTTQRKRRALYGTVCPLYNSKVSNGDVATQQTFPPSFLLTEARFWSDLGHLCTQGHWPAPGKWLLNSLGQCFSKCGPHTNRAPGRNANSQALP